ncbi:MAG: phosphoribosylformylglycinamidine synthase subunit PurQ, partial [Verrucomicrobiaceae bacterium]|nr:phosphoribosylformylglycinamidine synthase subunit PurQ [Verrucomicrobiaceae bacterium]
MLSGFGINCETETMAVFEMAGASADRIHVNRLVSGEATLSDYDIMAVPGGFSFGDHLGSGRLMGNRLRFGLREQ